MRRLLLMVVLATLLAAPVAAHEPSRLSSADLSAAQLDRAGAGWLMPALERIASIAPARPAPPAYRADPAPGKLELVGHNPLNNRGMNAAIAVHGAYAYVGSRSDGTHVDAGVMIIDVRDPAKPTVVGQLGLPDQGRPGESSRELRIIPHLGLLLVLNHGCSELIHRCANPAQAGVNVVPSNVRFFDITGENAAAPKLVATYLPSDNRPQTPHEIFVWSDPLRPGRTLLYMTTPSTESSGRNQLVVTDISRAREGVFTEITKWKTRIGNPDRDNRLHSLTVSNDGRRAFLAYLGGGFLVADTSQVAEAREKPEIGLVTPVENRVFWTDPGAHSAIKLWGRDWALTTDEVYGKLGGVLPDHGCPWGWVRMIDIADATRPVVASEYRLPVNDPNTCADVPPDREHLSSFSAHNPTLTKNLAIITWHGAGLQVVSIADPRAPAAAAEYVPTPLPVVQTEDPALSSGRDKVVMWSFPLIVDGLIYVVDLRNGFYVLRYSGPFAEEVSGAKFLDGNSNSGDALALEPAVPAGGLPPSRPGGPPQGAQPKPVTKLPPPCLRTPLALTRRGLGPFRLGSSRERVRLRGGTTARRRSGQTVWCVARGGYVGVAFRRDRAVLALTTTRGVRSSVRPGLRWRAVRRVLKRERRVARGVWVAGRRVVVVRRSRVAAVGVRAKRLRGRALRAAVRRARAS